MSDVTATAAPLREWRVGALVRTLVLALPGVAVLGALVLGITALDRRSGELAWGGLVSLAVAAPLGLLAWWVILRPRLALTADEVVVVNPWGTQRVPLAEVATLSPGFVAAHVQLRNGFAVPVYALADAVNVLPPQGPRVHEAAVAIADAQRQAGLP
jgi:hypothetical protein